MKLIIGLTGLIGSGKTMVATEFNKLGIDIIDTDQIAHNITASNGQAIPSIEKVFGKEFIENNFSLNRAKMRGLIFTDKEAKRQLENILHPLILANTYQKLAKSTSIYTIIAVPLLFKSLSYMSLINRSIFVDCKRSTIIKRVISRSNLNVSQIKTIISSQVDRETQILLCDDVLDNNYTHNEMYNNVLKLDYKYKNLTRI